jgi:hypothetical protein
MTQAKTGSGESLTGPRNEEVNPTVNINNYHTGTGTSLVTSYQEDVLPFLSKYSLISVFLGRRRRRDSKPCYSKGNLFLKGKRKSGGKRKRMER